MMDSTATVLVAGSANLDFVVRAAHIPAPGETGVVKVSAVTWGTFDDAESKTCTRPEYVNERLLVRPGDLLISRANTMDLVGACVLVGCVDRRVMLSDKILRLEGPAEFRLWILWYLRSLWGRTQIERRATGNQQYQGH